MGRTRKPKGTERNNTRRMPRLLREYKWRCCHCGVKVQRPPKGISQNQYKPPPNMATVDHLYDRNDIRRYIDDGRTFVLSCFKCNQGRRTYLTFAPWRFVEIIDIRDLIQNHD